MLGGALTEYLSWRWTLYVNLLFLFLTYYPQQTLGYSPLVTGAAFLPISAGLIVASNVSTIVLMPRAGPKPLVGLGMLAAAGGAASSAAPCSAPGHCARRARHPWHTPR